MCTQASVLSKAQRLHAAATMERFCSVGLKLTCCVLTARQGKTYVHTGARRGRGVLSSSQRYSCLHLACVCRTSSFACPILSSVPSYCVLDEHAVGLDVVDVLVDDMSVPE